MLPQPTYAYLSAARHNPVPEPLQSRHHIPSHHRSYDGSVVGEEPLRAPEVREEMQLAAVVFVESAALCTDASVCCFWVRHEDLVSSGSGPCVLVSTNWGGGNVEVALVE